MLCSVYNTAGAIPHSRHSTADLNGFLQKTFQKADSSSFDQFSDSQNTFQSNLMFTVLKKIVLKKQVIFFAVHERLPTSATLHDIFVCIITLR